MSGFEVAGFVLGSFPLAITALEKYREVARRMGFWIHMRVAYQQCKYDLAFHRLVFIRNLRQLILPLVADDDTVKVLVSDYGGVYWKDPALNSLLEQRLSESYELYLEYVKGIQKTVKSIQHELAFDKQATQDAL
jgi:hypothetical protein